MALGSAFGFLIQLVIFMPEEDYHYGVLEECIWRGGVLAI